MSNRVYGIIMAIVFLVGSNIVYKTFELRESVQHLGLTIAELDLATKEFSCDLQRVHAYEQGHKQGFEDANNE